MKKATKKICLENGVINAVELIVHHQRSVCNMQKIKLYQSEDRRHRALAEINTDGQGTLVFQRQPEGSKTWEEIFRDKEPMSRDKLDAIIERENALCQV